MNRSEQVNELVTALAKAQLEFLPIEKEVENPFYKRKYADLSAIIAATRPSLNKNGLVVVQSVRCLVDLAVTEVETTLLHSSGQYISEVLQLQAGQGNRFDPQTIGSSQTYGRRYAMQAILGVAAEPDDDANALSSGSKDAAKEVGERKVAAMKQRVAQQASEKEPEPSGANGHSVPQEASNGEVYGVLKQAKRIKNGKAMALQVIDPNDKPVLLFCFDNRKWTKDGADTSMFDLLEMAAEGKGQSIRGRVKASGQYTNLTSLVALGNVTFDDDGVPVIDRTNA